MTGGYFMPNEESVNIGLLSAIPMPNGHSKMGIIDLVLGQKSAKITKMFLSLNM